MLLIEYIIISISLFIIGLLIGPASIPIRINIIIIALLSIMLFDIYVGLIISFYILFVDEDEDIQTILIKSIKKIKKINRSDFDSWKEYYFEYQYRLAKEYYIPFLKIIECNPKVDSKDIDINKEEPDELKNPKIIDIGCGNGGFISAFKEISTNLTGIEIKEFDWDNNKDVKFIVGDILKLTSELPDAPHQLVDSAWPKDVKENLQIDYDYNIIILRDVIEHIPLNEKIAFLKSLQKITHPCDEKHLILVTFPPFYSPFGLHQQVFCKSILKYTPYLSLLPTIILKFILKLFGENEHTVKKLLEIKDCRMTIRRFLEIVNNLGFREHPLYRTFFTVRPSHQLRYGLKTRRSYLDRIPLLRELFVTGVAFILQISQPCLCCDSESSEPF